MLFDVYNLAHNINEPQQSGLIAATEKYSSLNSFVKLWNFVRESICFSNL